MSNTTHKPESKSGLTSNRWLNKKIASLSVIAGVVLIATGGTLLYFSNLPEKNAKAATSFDNVTSANITANAVVGQTIGSVAIANLPSTVTSCDIVRGNTIGTTTAGTLSGTTTKTCTKTLSTAQSGVTLNDTVASLDFIPVTLGLNGGAETRTFHIKPVLPSTVGTQNQTTDANYQFNKSTISFLKADNSSAQNAILHKDWRTGVSSGTGNADMKIVVTGFQAAQNLLDATNYVCNISVRSAGSTGSYINLAYDANSNGLIDSGETTNAIPYSSTNGCYAMFTNSNRVGGGGQTVLTNSNASTYQWDVKVDIKDGSGNIIDTRNSFYEFKFAAIIPGG